MKSLMRPKQAEAVQRAARVIAREAELVEVRHTFAIRVVALLLRLAPHAINHLQLSDDERKLLEECYAMRGEAQ